MPRKARRHEATRSAYRMWAEGVVYKDPSVKPRNRGFPSVRKAALVWAGQWLPVQSTLVRKPPQDLLRSFTRRLDASRAFGKLLTHRDLDLARISMAATALVNHFDPQDVASPRGEEFFGLSDRKLEQGELRKRSRVLANAEAILREARRADLADELEVLARIFSEAAEQPPRRKRVGTRPGRPAQRLGDLVVDLDAVLDPIPGAARHRLIAELVSDFCRPYQAKQVSDLLKDRWRRLERNEGSYRE